MLDIENCKIKHYPSDILARPAAPVEEIDDNIHKLVKKMIDVMVERNGIGLAASQVGIPLRLFIVSLDTTAKDVKVYINPKISMTGQLETAEEGCLSIPGLCSNIKRYKKCSVTATDLDGNEFTQQAEGLLARCLQHENDHIEGVTIANRITQVARIINRKLFKKLELKHQAEQ